MGNSSVLFPAGLQYGRPLSLDFQNWEGGLFMLSGSQGPFVSLTSWKRDHDVSMADQIFSSSNGQDWGSFLGPIFGLVYSFYKWLYFLLLVECSHYGCHPSMKVVPQFFPVARNFLLRAFSSCCFVSIQPYRIGFGSLRRKAVDRKGQSGTRLLIPHGICPFSLCSKTFQI